MRGGFAAVSRLGVWLERPQKTECCHAIQSGDILLWYQAACAARRAGARWLVQSQLSASITAAVARQSATPPSW